MTRLENYIKALDKCKHPDEKEGALILLLMEYSDNIISHMSDNKRHIKEWLESEVRA